LQEQEPLQEGETEIAELSKRPLFAKPAEVIQMATTVQDGLDMATPAEISDTLTQEAMFMATHDMPILAQA